LFKDYILPFTGRLVEFKLIDNNLIYSSLKNSIVSYYKFSIDTFELVDKYSVEKTLEAFKILNFQFTTIYDATVDQNHERIIIFFNRNNTNFSYDITSKLIKSYITFVTTGEALLSISNNGYLIQYKPVEGATSYYKVINQIFISAELVVSMEHDYVFISMY
jgi:hypothetical protein